MRKIEESKLDQLSPTAFENLVFDLVRISSVKNLVWRTPGPDGGRDLQGEFTDVDFAGTSRTSKWFIECKRYSSTISWPTVWEKLAYADSHQSDALLIVSTATFSPQCLNEIENWSGGKRSPSIRVWPRNELIYRLELNPAVAFKYGLIEKPDISADAMADLALHLSKMCQSAASAVSFGLPSDRYASTSMALAELLYTRAKDLREHGEFRRTGLLNQERWPPYLNGVPALDLSKFDRAGIFAVVECIHLIENCNLTVRQISPHSIKIIPEGGKKNWLAARNCLARFHFGPELQSQLRGAKYA